MTSSLNKIFAALLFLHFAFAFAAVKTDFTLLIYMNGSDLESRNCLASADIDEMLEPLPKSGNFNALILTGGTKKWCKANVPNDSTAYFLLDSSGFKKIKTEGLRNMGDQQTLTDFLNYAFENFSAERYALIFWNHGAGSAIGFGRDELFEKKSLTVKEIKNALANAKKREKFSFIGFDACLMASVEIADAVSPFANYLAASQDLEPGKGWDYKNLFSLLRNDPKIKTDSLLKNLTDDFVNAYINSSLENASLSVIDLDSAKIAKLRGEVAKSTQKLKDSSFMDIAKKRQNAVSFGKATWASRGTDMIDIGFFYESSGALKNAVDNAVIYNKFSDNNSEANGLSIYFPYENKKLAKSLDGYSFDSAYVEFINNFSDSLTSEAKIADSLADNKIRPEQLLKIRKIYAALFGKDSAGNLLSYGFDQDGVSVKNGVISKKNDKWIKIGENFASVYPLLASMENLSYSSPILLNGARADLIINYDNSEKCRSGCIRGAQFVLDDDIPFKGYQKIEDGDTITFLREKWDEGTNLGAGKYIKGASVIVDAKELVINIKSVSSGEFLTAFCLVDLSNKMKCTKPLLAKPKG